MADDPQIGENALAAQIAFARGGERADVFLDEQTRLARLQIEQLEEENATRRRLLKLEHASAVFKLTLEIAVAFVAAVIVIGLGTAMWNAANDSGLVVESFSVPPDLAARGLTGEVVAAKLLDRLSSLQAQTASNRAPSSYANNWGSDIKLQIPDTGVSIGEFNRSLHSWLGHQTRITGEVYRTSTGIAVTARAGSDTSPTFTGPDADLDTLMQKAAEQVYRATQPYRYAVYLVNAGRPAEAEPLYEQLIARGSPQDRAWALVGVENLYLSRGESARALRTLRRALEVRPNFIMAYFNLAGVEGQLQHDEEALAAQKKVVEILHSHRDSDVIEQSSVMGLAANEAALAADYGDYQSQIRLNAELEALPDFNGQVENAHQNDAIAYAFLHDAKGVRDVFASLPATTRPQTLLSREGNSAFCDMLLGNPKTIVAKAAKFDAVFSRLGVAGRDALERQFWPVEALAFALAGRFAEAHKLAGKTPVDCVICLRVRARIDSLEKNWNGAAYWYARAHRAAPSLPFVETDWGRMLLAKGDAAGAIEKLRRASAKSPNYADPYEIWGEALMAENRSDLALAKFADADRRAPNWQRLHRKWGEALGYLGRKDESAKQFALAKENAQ